MTHQPVLRAPLGATIHHLLDQLPGLRREGPTPPTGRPGRAAAVGPFSAAPLTAKQYAVLQAVADRRICRDLLLGTLEPHMLNGHDVVWTLRALVVRGLVQLQPIGPPRLTTRGRRTLDAFD